LVKWEFVVDIVAIVVIGAICIKALDLGIDAALVGTVCAIIGGIAGYVFKGARAGR